MASHLPLVLVADDHEDARYAVERMVAHQGFAVASAADGHQAIAQAEKLRPSLILLDLMMPGLDGFEVITRLKADPTLRYIPIILLTARDAVEDVTRGLDLGADDYVVKPFKAEELIARLRSALRLKALYSRLADSDQRAEFLAKEASRTVDQNPIIGESAIMKRIDSMITRAAQSDAPVLVTGPSGTGKELAARALHERSPRSEKPFLARNCAAFSEHLLESELFGHVRGAFTSAIKDQRGIFDAADGGTLFLDEIGEMPLALQPKLLRVLQEGTFTPVGSTAEKAVDVRIIAATNRDLPEMVKARTFREDLFYRLNVLQVQLPPLSERREDIPALANEFLTKRRKGGNRLSKQLHQDTMLALMNYSWPGNIRELQNEIERLVILSGDDDVITPDLLSDHIARVGADLQAGLESESRPAQGELKDALAQLERSMIQQALEKCGWNRSEAARALGISRSNLLSKIEIYGLKEKQAQAFVP